MNRTDLEAILQDLEDICARIPNDDHINFKPTLSFYSQSATMGATHVAFDCKQHHYILTVIKEGRAITNRVATQDELLNRLFPQEEGEENTVTESTSFPGL